MQVKSNASPVPIEPMQVFVSAGRGQKRSADEDHDYLAAGPSGASRKSRRDPEDYFDETLKVLQRIETNTDNQRIYLIDINETLKRIADALEIIAKK